MSSYDYRLNRLEALQRMLQPVNGKYLGMVKPRGARVGATNALARVQNHRRWERGRRGDGGARREREERGRDLTHRR